MTIKNDERTVSQLFGDSLSELAKLIQNEVDLARAELRQKIAVVGGGIGFIAAGSVLLVPALVMVLFAVASWLIVLGFAIPLAYLAAGLGAAIIALALVWVGVGRLSGDALKPTATINELDRDKKLAKELMR
jgi:Putative Actinobacterial Holin-X, holin superfamily III